MGDLSNFTCQDFKYFSLETDYPNTVIFTGRQADRIDFYLEEAL